MFNCVCVHVCVCLCVCVCVCAFVCACVYRLFVVVIGWLQLYTLGLNDLGKPAGELDGPETVGAALEVNHYAQTPLTPYLSFFIHLKLRYGRS